MCIYHDVGYPAEKLPLLVTDIFINAIGRKVSGLFDWSSVIIANENDNHIKELSNAYAQHFEDEKDDHDRKFRKWFYHRLFEKHDHGALAALILLNKMEYLFSWNDVPGKDSNRLLNFLKRNVDTNWVKDAEINNTKIKKTDNFNITVKKGKNLLTLKLNEKDEKITIKTDDDKTNVYECIVRNENSKLNIYHKYTKEEKRLLYEAGLAICLHNMKYKPDEKDEFDIGQNEIKRFPFAFFLQYCDYAQEWGRRIYHERMRVDKGIADFNIEKDLDTRLIDIECNKKEVRVKIKYINAPKGYRVVNKQNLDQLFKDFDNQFKHFWVSDQVDIHFIVEAIDKNDDTVGSFSATRSNDC